MTCCCNCGRKLTHGYDYHGRRYCGYCVPGRRQREDAAERRRMVAASARLKRLDINSTWRKRERVERRVYLLRSWDAREFRRELLKDGWRVVRCEPYLTERKQLRRLKLVIERIVEAA